jgi:hypothetical protein
MLVELVNHQCLSDDEKIGFGETASKSHVIDYSNINSFT